MFGDGALFFGLWLQRPLHIAAVTPSSAAVVRVMAQLVDFACPGMVLELGAGTGSPTRGLPGRGGLDRLAAAVSSLPTKWFPVAAQRAVVGLCLARLGRGGRLLQMTNAFSSPLAMRELGLAGARVAHVWRNLPPAQIWAYSRVTE